ncbi:MAG TPA: adenylate/guanylate cyclase domain-containing protein, partial [Nitriliruptorales bacterium]
MTVVFADVVGFTALTETLDPERVKSVLDRCFARLAEDVTVHGGRVDKVVGDAVIALFGAPVAHEDDAERAVRAALTMNQTMADHAQVEGLDLALRVGVNTGEVVVGAMATGDEYTAMGDVVNVAQRLQTAAAPGQVLVGARTHEATRARIRYDDIGAVKVRGRDEAVPAWRALDPATLPGQRPAHATTPFVGRDEELALLRSVAGLAITRERAHTVLITGDAGVGKRRLVDEATRVIAAEHGALVLRGRCLPYGEASVLWPIAEMIQAACEAPLLVAALEDGQDPAMRRFDEVVGFTQGDGPPPVPTIAEGLARLLADDGDGSQEARAQAVGVLIRFLETFTAQQPVVLVLTDLHWADAALLALVEEILTRLRRTPLLAIGTGRPELRGRWQPGGLTNVLHLDLESLDHEAARALLTGLVGRDPGPELGTMLVERSGGNPLFLEEHVALLHESGGLEDAEADVTQTLALPASLRGLVAARLDALTDGERSVFADAAVVGRSGPVAALEALGGASGRGDVLATAQRLESRDLLRLTGPDYELRSDVFREVAYETLPKAERARRHAWLADWLEARADHDEHLDRIAAQYGRAAQLVRTVGSVDGVPADIEDRALDRLRRSADRARQRGTHVVAVRSYSRALELSAGPGPQRWELLLGRAQARIAVHDLGPARADLDEVLSTTDNGEAQEIRARALTVLGEHHQKAGDTRRAIQTLREAVDRWRALERPDGAADALRALGMTQLFAGELDAAREAIEQALAEYEQQDDDRGQAWALQNLAWIAFMSGRMTESQRHLAAARELFGELGDRAGLVFTDGLLGFVRFYEGALDEAERLAVQVSASAEENDERWGMAITDVLLGMVALFRGRITAAVEHTQRALGRFRALGDVWGQMQAGLASARALVVAGRVDEGLEVLGQARSLARRSRNAGMRATVDQFSAAIAVQLGDGRRARRDLAALERREQERGQTATLEARVHLGLAHVLSGDPGAALRELEQVLGAVGGEPPFAYATSALALAAGAAGDVDRARAAGDDLDGATGATYLDRCLAGLGLALGSAASGSRDDAAKQIRRVRDLLAQTEDVLTSAVVALAGAYLESTDQDDEAVTGARRALKELGVTADGWDRLLASRL